MKQKTAEKYFSDRADGGRQLAEKLRKFKKEDAYLIALARGGVPVAYEISEILNIPVSVLVVRKIGIPENKEYAIGAIAEGDFLVLNEKEIKNYDLSQEQLDRIIYNELAEIEKRIKIYRNHDVLPNLKNKTVIVVDDGLATGYTALAAVKSVKSLRPKKVIFSAPVCAYDSIKNMLSEYEETICIVEPNRLMSVDYYYENFNQINDKQVVNLLNRSHAFFSTH